MNMGNSGASVVPWFHFPSICRFICACMSSAQCLFVCIVFVGWELHLLDRKNGPMNCSEGRFLQEQVSATSINIRAEDH